MLPSAGQRLSGGLDEQVHDDPLAPSPSPPSDVVRAYWSLRRAQRDDEWLEPFLPDLDSSEDPIVASAGRLHTSDDLDVERRPGAENYRANSVNLSAQQLDGGADHVVHSTLAENAARVTMAGQNATPGRIFSQRIVSERVVSRRRLVSQTQIVNDFMEHFGEAGIDDSPHTTRFTVFRRTGLPDSDQYARAFHSPPHPTRQRIDILVAPSQRLPDSDLDGSHAAPNALPDVSRQRIARNSIRREQLALGTSSARLAISHIPHPSTLAEELTRPQVTANRAPDPSLIQLRRHLDHAQFTIFPTGQFVT